MARFGGSSEPSREASGRGAGVRVPLLLDERSTRVDAGQASLMSRQTSSSGTTWLSASS